MSNVPRVNIVPSLHPPHSVAASRLQVEYLNANDAEYQEACQLADVMYRKKLGFSTLEQPDWLLALTDGQTILGSASAWFGYQAEELVVFQLGKSSRREMLEYLQQQGATADHEYAEITCFNVVGTHQRYKQALLGYIFWYLHVIGVKATLNIQPIHLGRTASRIGANQTVFCKASSDEFVGDAATRKALTDGYIKTLRPVCVGVRPAHVTDCFRGNSDLQMGVTPGPQLQKILS